MPVNPKASNVAIIPQGAGGAGSTTTTPPVSTPAGGGGHSGGLPTSSPSGVASQSATSTPITPQLPPASGLGGSGGPSQATPQSTVTVNPNDPAGAVQTFAAFFNDAWMNDPNLNINALVQAVLRNSYQDNQKDLKDYALKVEFYNNLKKNIRAEIARARSFQSANATTNGNANFPNNASFEAQPTGADGYNGSAQVSTDGSGNWGAAGVSPNTGMSATATINNANELNSYISSMEEYLTSVGDDAQLAQVDLQNMAQNQQQTLQTLSNLSKSFNDVSMAIIRNIQG